MKNRGRPPIGEEAKNKYASVRMRAADREYILKVYGSVQKFFDLILKKEKSNGNSSNNGNVLIRNDLGRKPSGE